MAEPVVIHAECEAELNALARRSQRDAMALERARDKLAVLGASLGYPHSTAIRGAPGLRELRPRAGRCPWRLVYHPGRPFVVLALAPEALRDPRGFRRAVDEARTRLDEWKGP